MKFVWLCYAAVVFSILVILVLSHLRSKVIIRQQRAALAMKLRPELKAEELRQTRWMNFWLGVMVVCAMVGIYQYIDLSTFGPIAGWFK